MIDAVTFSKPRKWLDKETRADSTHEAAICMEFFEKFAQFTNAKRKIAAICE